MFLQRYSSHRAAFDFLGVSFQRNLSVAGKRQSQLCFCVFSPLFFTSTCLYLPALSFEMPSFYLAPLLSSYYCTFLMALSLYPTTHPTPVCASEVCWCSVGFYTVEAPKTSWHRRRVEPGPSDHPPPPDTRTDSPRTLQAQPCFYILSFFPPSFFLAWIPAEHPFMCLKWRPWNEGPWRRRA